MSAVAQMDYVYQRLPEFAVGTYVRPLPQAFADDAAATPPKPFECAANATGLRCTSDCRTRALCAGSATPMHTQSCASVDPHRPYCVNDACTAQPVVNNTACNTAFMCTGSGLYPDANDCVSYHSCAGAGQPAKLLRCPSQYVYDSRQQKCRRRESPLQCHRFDCSRVQNDVVVYRSNPAYYAYCMSGEQSQVVVFRCDDVENEAFSKESGRCEFQCKRRGNFTDRSDCASYQMCEFQQGRLRATKVTCPEAYHYGGEACVPDAETKCVPELVAAA